MPKLIAKFTKNGIFESTVCMAEISNMSFQEHLVQWLVAENSHQGD